jgi:hypothetical protein
MRKFVVIVAAVAACTIVASAAAAPGGQGPARPSIEAKRYCPPGTNVAYVTQDVVDQGDVGLGGNTWATDSYQRIISIVRITPNTYCGATRVTGSFSTLAGPSPGLTGKVNEGDTGSVYGGERTTVFTARWAPRVPTSGSIGTVYCDEYGCPAAIDWASLYFRNVIGYSLAWWTFSYYGGSHGNWLNRADMSSGDIVDYS